MYLHETGGEMSPKFHKASLIIKVFIRQGEEPHGMFGKHNPN